MKVARLIDYKKFEFTDSDIIGAMLTANAY
jgi:hypothetical protein